MIARVPMLICMIWAAGTAMADPVTVSGGEHPGFTRLVMRFSDRPAWRDDRLGRSHRVDFVSEDKLTFDLSRVFRLIGRDRVSDVRVTENGLQFDIACDCDVMIDEVGSHTLVADILPRAPGRPVAMDGVMLPPAPVTGDVPPGLPGPIAGTPTWRAPDQPSRPGVQGPLDAVLPELTARSPLLDELDPLFEQSSRSVAVDLVGRQFSRAAAQGLVAANPDLETRDDTPGGETGSLEERSNLSVTTGLDAAIRSGRDDVPPTESGAVCLPDSQVDVTAWGDAQDKRSLGHLRSEAIAEDGSVNSKGALPLAQYYLSLGFGAEASIAASFIEKKRDRRLLNALAEVIDHGRSDSDVLDGQVYCQGAIALWAALARPIDRPPATADHILAAFSALPPHLRTHLGPLLSERLRQAGLTQAARAAVNAVTRGGDRTDESDLVIARLDLNGTEADTARSTLSQLSRGTDVTAAEALLELLKDAEARGMAPNPAWVEEAPSLVRAIEGTEAARALNIAALRGQIALDRFDGFRAALVEETPGLTPDIRRDLAGLALAAAVARADNATFIKAEIGLSRLSPPDVLERATRFAIADRLMSIGLASRAQPYLPGDPATPAEIEVTAKVFLANGRAREAVALLSRDDADTAALKGTVLATAGRDDAAIAAFQEAGRPSAALAAALRSGDWGWIAASGIKDVAEATRVLTLPEASAAEMPSNGALIEASRTLREQARTLLNVTKPTIFEEIFTN